MVFETVSPEAYAAVVQENEVLRARVREVLLILRGESPAAARLANSYADTCGIDLDGPLAYRNRAAQEGRPY